MKKENVSVKKDCHSRMSLSGISTAFNSVQGGDPRQKPSGMTNKINCYAEKLLLSIPTAVKTQGRDPEQKLFRMTLFKTTGFTLIELLVVVLIIGILAAVALPQYQKAVAKSRFAALKPIVKSIKDAEEIYYNEHGNYGALADLDVQAPSGTVAASETSGHDYVRASSRSGNRYTVYFDHSENFAGNVYCEAETDNTIAEAVCVAEQGVDTELVQDGHKLYLMSGSSTGGFAPTWDVTGSMYQNGTYGSATYSMDGQTIKFEYAASHDVWSVFENGRWKDVYNTPTGSYPGSQSFDKLCKDYPFISVCQE